MLACAYPGGYPGVIRRPGSMLIPELIRASFCLHDFERFSMFQGATQRLLSMFQGATQQQEESGGGRREVLRREEEEDEGG